MVRVGSRCLNHPNECRSTLHTLLALCWCGSCRFEVLEPPYTSLGWCGSCRFAVLEPPRSSASSGWFKHSEPQRTDTNHTSTELARCVGCFCTRSGGSSTSNLHEPHQHSFSRVVQAQRTYTNHTITVLKVCRALVRGC